MPLSPGTHLGRYEILAPLGAGGMGEVYRAKDTNLKRQVALKVLPEAVARDVDRMTRFQREAEMLALLNHPGIAAIYGLEEGALIMELVEGETLSGPLPIETALRYAAQIAEALEYAHERGVIHRDLKPANIKVTSEGTVKLLDFGLAKAIENRAAPSGDPTKSPTLTLGVTAAGFIMGTAAYMPPEQANGKATDRRSDIWSFGAVLYEMLSGKRAFDGESVSDTLASVLKLDPDWDALPASTPASIRRLVRRCLTKDRKQRLQAIGEARITIEEALAGAPPEEAPVTPAGSRPGMLLWAAAAGVLAIMAAIGWWFALQSSRPVDRPLLRLSVDLGPDAVASHGITAAISPDGTRLAFPARGPDGKRQLATRLLDRSQATLLPGTEDADDPFFSPDGQWIGFFAKGKMNKVSVQGGAVVTLCDAPDGRGGAWGEDGNIIATLNSTTGFGLSRVPAAGGTPQALTKPGKTGEATHRWPQILPGGQAVLFMGNKTAASYEDASIEVLSLKSGQVKVVQRGGYFGRYLPGGYLVYIHQGTLFGLPFDLGRLEVQGTPVPLLDNVAANLSIGGGQFDFSRNGSFIYSSGKSWLAIWPVVWLDRAGKTQPLLAAPKKYMELRLSPDGKRLAFSSPAGVEIYDWGHDTMMRLTFITQPTGYPVWAPNGKHIVFQSENPSTFSLWWIRADGAEGAQTLLESKNELRPYSFSPDGKRLAFSEQNAQTGFDLWTLPLDTSDPEHPKPSKPELFLRSPFDELEPAFSPNGRWIAYASAESGRSEVWVRPFPARGPSGSGKWLISTGGGQFPIWSHDGRELFYESLDNRIMVAACTAKGNSFAAEKSRPWGNTQLLDLASSWNLDLAPDGKRFAAILPRAYSTGEQKGSVHVTFLLNFFDEVKRRIPKR